MGIVVIARTQCERVAPRPNAMGAACRRAVRARPVNVRAARALAITEGTKAAILYFFDGVVRSVAAAIDDG